MYRLSSRQLWAAAVVGVLLAAVMAATAVAHYNSIERHYGRAYVDTSHSHVYGCDTSSDGYQVKVQYTKYGTTYQSTDPDGAGGYCGHGDLPGGGYLGSYRLCKVNVDCSEWKGY
jgi:hypothetical protein